MIEGDADTIQILIADSNTKTRESLQELLSHQPDFEVIGSVSSGREAVEFAKAHRPDVIIIDDDILEFDGYEKIHNFINFWDINVIILSESYSKQNLEKAFLCDVRYILPKPVKNYQLITSLRNLYVPLRTWYNNPNSF